MPLITFPFTEFLIEFSSLKEIFFYEYQTQTKLYFLEERWEMTGEKEIISFESTFMCKRFLPV